MGLPVIRIGKLGPFSFREIRTPIIRAFSKVKRANKPVGSDQVGENAFRLTKNPGITEFYGFSQFQGAIRADVEFLLLSDRTSIEPLFRAEMTHNLTDRLACFVAKVFFDKLLSDRSIGVEGIGVKSSAFEQNRFQLQLQAI